LEDRVARLEESERKAAAERADFLKNLMGLRQDMGAEIHRIGHDMDAKIDHEARIREQEDKKLMNAVAKEAELREQGDQENLQAAKFMFDDLQAQIEALRRQLHEESELARKLREIESRGNVQVDMQTGHVRFLNTIDFVPKTTNDEPKAELVSPESAIAICKDIADVQHLFHCPIEVQGHTKGGEGAFWQTLANERARIIVEQIVENNVNRSMIKASGFPGKTGRNQTLTVVNMMFHSRQVANGILSPRSTSAGPRKSSGYVVTTGAASIRTLSHSTSMQVARTSLGGIEATQIPIMGTQSVPLAGLRVSAQPVPQPVRTLQVNGVQSRSLTSLAGIQSTP
jgi:hypothetical protein